MAHNDSKFAFIFVFALQTHRHRHHRDVASLAHGSQTGSEVKAIEGPSELLPAPRQRLCVVSGRWDLAFSSPQRARWRLLSHWRWELAVILSVRQPFLLPLLLRLFRWSTPQPPHSTAQNHSVWAAWQFWYLFDFIYFFTKVPSRGDLFFSKCWFWRRKRWTQLRNFWWTSCELSSNR